MMVLAIRYWKQIGFALLIIGAIVGFRIWLAKHDAATLSGYVALSEKTAAEARAAEAKRQASIAAQADEEYRKKLATVQASEAQAQADLEKEIAQYEKRLVDAKRDCLLSDDDLGSILHHR